MPAKKKARTSIWSKKASEKKTKHTQNTKSKRTKQLKIKVTNPILLSFFPFLRWFNDFSWGSLSADLLAGITVALVLIPQSLAYAELAGLPAYYGLYAAFLPPIIAALFGSSRHLSTGPVALVSLMTATALSSVAITSSSEFIAYTTMIAFTLGVIQLLLGSFRLGSLLSFISHPVIYGFTSAAVIIIAFLQLPSFLGGSINTQNYLYQSIIPVLRDSVSHLYWPTLAFGIAALVTMYLFKWLNSKIPYVLIVVVVATIISWGIGYRISFTGSSFSIASPQILTKITEYNQKFSQIATNEREIIALKGQVESGLLNDIDQFELESKYKRLEFETSQLEIDFDRLKDELSSTALYDINPAQRKLVLAKDVHGKPLSKDIWYLDLDGGKLNLNSLTFIQGGSIVGDIPKGLPNFAIPTIDLAKMMSLLPAILMIAIVGFTQSIAVSQAIAFKTKQSLDYNQELIGQGMSNIVSSIGKGLPVAGSFMRTSVNYESGGVTGLSNVIAGIVVLLTMLFFTPLLKYLPQVVLSAIIVVSVLHLLDIKKIVEIFKASKQDGIAAVVTFAGTLYFAPDLEKGLALGVALSILYYLYNNAHPRIVFLSKYRDGTFHDSKLFHLARCTNIAIIRFDAPLFFANAENLENAVLTDLVAHKKISAVVIVASGINMIDATGVEVLRELISRLRESKKEIYFAGLKTSVTEVMEESGLLEELGENRVFPNQKRAVSYVLKHIKKHDDAKHCPLKRYVKIHKETAHYSHNMNYVSEYFHRLLFGNDNCN